MSTSLSRRILLVLCIVPSLASAAVTLTPLFSDHMVLQRGMDVPVWGKAAPGEVVTVEFLGKKVIATADEKGDWSLKLPAMKEADGSSMTISGSGGAATNNEKPLVFKDVLVGDVWICSGQSNMGFLVKQVNDNEKEMAAAEFPN